MHIDLQLPRTASLTHTKKRNMLSLIGFIVLWIGIGTGLSIASFAGVSIPLSVLGILITVLSTLLEPNTPSWSYVTSIGIIFWLILLLAVSIISIDPLTSLVLWCVIGLNSLAFIAPKKLLPQAYWQWWVVIICLFTGAGLTLLSPIPPNTSLPFISTISALLLLYAHQSNSKAALIHALLLAWLTAGTQSGIVLILVCILLLYMSIQNTTKRTMGIFSLVMLIVLTMWHTFQGVIHWTLPPLIVHWTTLQEVFLGSGMGTFTPEDITQTPVVSILLSDIGLIGTIITTALPWLLTRKITPALILLTLSFIITPLSFFMPFGIIVYILFTIGLTQNED